MCFFLYFAWYASRPRGRLKVGIDTIAREINEDIRCTYPQ